MEDQTWKIFNAISKFITDLGDVFGNRQHSLLLYHRFINKTLVSHHEAITKHVSAMTTFVTLNKTAILNQSAVQFQANNITYSKKVNIKMDEIFRMADQETSKMIWGHLLLLLEMIDPASGALKILKESQEEKKGNEGEFLSGLVKKIESTSPSGNGDPMQAIMGMMTSGVFTDMIGDMSKGMQDGSLNVGKLFGALQGMMGGLGGEMPGAQQASLVQNVPAIKGPDVD
jgi:hypothetical protein